MSEHRFILRAVAPEEGGIIADVIPIDHRRTAERMADLGKDIEARVLARAVTAHAEG
ncbi:MAG: hypothetical protein AAFV37_02860 [Pseudomonadota bacterium]